jgi:hypothetical protein
MRRLSGAAVLAFFGLTFMSGCGDKPAAQIMTQQRNKGGTTAPEALDTKVEDVPKDEAEKAARIIDQAIIAHGGNEHLAQMRIITVGQQGWILLGGRKEIKREYVIQFPDRLHMWVGPQGVTPSVVGVNASGGWLQVGPNIIDLADDQLEEARMLVYMFHVMSLRPLRIEDFVLKPLPDVEFNGQTCNGVKVMRKNQVAIDLYFDAKTHLLVRIVFKAHEQTRTREFEIRLSEYKAVDGVQLPNRWVTTTRSSNSQKIRR